MRPLAVSIVVAALLAPIVAVPAAEAQPKDERQPLTHRLLSRPDEIRALWTPERMQAARPMPMPVAEGFEPAVRGDGGLVPAVEGDVGFHFTSSRLVPAAAALVYPYSAVGRLFFNDGVSAFACSGSMVGPRVVLTAGHCVFEPETGSFFEDFLFVPAYLDGEAPFGAFAGTFVTTTPEWEESDGSFPNEADFGFLVLDDVDGEKAGDLTGWLGIKKRQLAPNHLTKLGYPGNFDDGEQMHRTASGDFGTFDETGAVAYGSDMGPGASGGPWIQNFGIKASGQRGGMQRRRNRIVGVSSFVCCVRDDGSIDRSFIIGSSEPGPSITAAFKEACREGAGNCKRRGRPSGPP